MRVSIIINPYAGSMQMDFIKQKISDALFRCQLHFHVCDKKENLSKFIAAEIRLNSNAFLICGGDGTVNTVLQSMLKYKRKDQALPPLCLISSGTANDLAFEMEISKRVDQAARLLLEGREKKIDLIELESNGEKKYMLTNGGLGIPALAADQANIVRQYFFKLLEDQTKLSLLHALATPAQLLLKKMGTLIYTASVLQSIKNWNSDDWSIQIEFSDHESIQTFAPFVLVSNQAIVGKKYLTAPFTANNDGFVNLLLIESTKTRDQLKELFFAFRGTMRANKNIKTFEVKDFTIRSLNTKRPLTFFGDGEILFREASEIKVRCLKENLSIMANNET
jgi:diacylglycerol kinase family enzyme